LRLLAAIALTFLAMTAALAQDDGAFLAAAAAGDVVALTRLLDAGQDIEVRDGNARTALMLATRANAIDAAKLLIVRGADGNAKDAIEDTPYLYAGAEGRTEILSAILAAGANLRDTNRYGGTALIPAAEKGHLDNVRLLLAAGVDPDHINRLGWTALLEAIILSDGGPVHQAIVETLIAGGADVNLADAEKVTPLEHARQRGYRNMVALLEAAGAR
jgi:ankyrin repeat protein